MGASTGRSSLVRRREALPRPASPSPAARRAALQRARPPHQGDPEPRPGYLPALDGLRAVAVFAVVAYHLGELSGGFLGVDVFFVISGFLITRLLLAEQGRSGRIALGSFWVRRFKRLLPALVVVVVAVAVGARLWLPDWRLGSIRDDALGALAYVANWRFVLSGQSYFDSGVAPSPLRHTWSLAIEEQFYVLWPLIVVGLAMITWGSLRRRVRLVAGAGAVISATWMAVAASTGTDLSRIYYGTDTRAFAILAGAWLASWWDGDIGPADRRGTVDRRGRRWSIAATVAMVPVAALFVMGTTSEVAFYQGGFQAMTVLSVALVAGLASGSGRMATVLGHRVPVWFGRRSYGIYLWSWPIQVFASEHLRLEGARLIMVVVAGAVALATLSYWLVEEPIRTGTRPAGWPPRRERTVRVPAPRLVASAVAVVVLVGALVGLSSGTADPPEYLGVSDAQVLSAALGASAEADEEEQRALDTPTTTVPIAQGPPGPFAGAQLLVPAGSPAAADGPPQAAASRSGEPLRVMVAGDSVGWSLGWELGAGLTPEVRVNNRALIGCGVMPRTAAFIVGSRAPEPYSERCDQADLAELRGLAATPDVVVLWLGAWEVYDHEFEERTYPVGSPRYAALLERRIQARVDRYRAAGVPTVMPLVPCFGPNAARLGDERHDRTRLAWVNARIRAFAAANPGWVRLVDPYDQVCDVDGRALRTTPEGDPLREDGAHFDPPAAVWFWNSWFAGQLGAAFEGDAPASVAAPGSAPGPTPSLRGGVASPPLPAVVDQ